MGAPIGFNLFGYISGSVGLGSATRNTLALLEKSGYPLSATDIPLPLHPLGHPHGFEHLLRPPLRSMPYAIDLFHFEPVVLEYWAAREGAFTPITRRFNVLIPFWELSKLPDPWVPPLRLADAVLAPSLHIKTVFEAADPSLPVIHFPQAVELPDVQPDRERWGFRDGETVFFTGFDATSDIERKNPLGVLEAFLTAFPSDPGVKLVIRIKNPSLDPRYAERIERIRQAAAADARIVVLDRTMPYAEVLSLYASIDVLVSLHRAEGLGLVLMECMSLGKPVIGTAWSGNMDFMDDRDSALVGYRLVPVEGMMDYYLPEYVGRPAEWAEPDLAQAADWMRRLAEDEELRCGMGEAARASMAARREPEARLRPFHELVALYERTGLSSPRHRAAVKGFREVQRAAIGNALRSPAKIARGAARLLHR